MEIKGRKGSTFVKEDEEPGRFNEEKLRALRPAFDPSGSVTAGNASSINDGAAAIVVVSPQRAKELGVKPQARILGYSTFSREPEWFTLAPVCAIEKLLQSLNLGVSDIDLFEVNEAFSVVTLAAMKQLHIPHEKMNVNGGAGGPGAPHRRQRHANPGDAFERDGQAAGPPRTGVAVHRRRRGRGNGRREDVVNVGRNKLRSSGIGTSQRPFCRLIWRYVFASVESRP